MISRKLSRRSFVAHSAISTAGLMLGTSFLNANATEERQDAYNLMREVAKYRKLDAYATSDLSEQNLHRQLDFADRLGIEKLFTATPMTTIKATPQEFRELNDKVHKAMKKYPNRLIGQFTLNPIYEKESLEEISRCVDMGMTGTRLYNQVKINDPLYYPIIEKLSELKILLFMHGECQLGVGGYRMKYDANKLPSTSTPEDFADAASRYPEAIFQFAHIGGGSDWECMCKTFEHHPNIYVDTGGSNNEENMIDFALQYLGEDRLFFGTDSSFYQSVGKILSSNLTESQLKKLFFDNYNSVLRRGGFGVS
jgi:predicted TIM-barrel fold metal-dependent hydrolase